MLLLIKVKFKAFFNSLIELGWRKILFFFFIGSGFFFLLSYFFFCVFRYLYFLEEFPDELKLFLVLKLMAMIFLAVFILVLISSLLVSLEIFFLSRDLPLLLSAPFSLKKIFNFKVLDVFLHSIAVPVFFASPMLAIFGLYFAPDLSSFAQVFVIFFLLIYSGSLAGVSLAMFIPLVASVKRLQPYISIFAVFMLSLLVIFLRLLRPERFFNPEEIGNIFQFIRSTELKSQFYFPFYWAAEGIVAAVNRDRVVLGRTILLFVGMISILSGYLLIVRQKFYFVIYEKVFQGFQSAYRSSWKISANRWQSLMKKELKTFFRSSTNWSQLLILLALIVLFALNLKYVPIIHPSVQILTAYLNILLVGFIAAGVAARFVLPIFAIESEGLPLLFSSPLERLKIVHFKFSFYLFPLLLLIFLLFWIGHFTLGYDLFTFLCGVIFLGFTTLTIAAYSMYSGVRLDIFSGRTPQQLIISRQGLLFMFYTLLFIFFSMILIGMGVVSYYRAQFWQKPVPIFEIIIIFSCFALINVLLSIFFYRRAEEIFSHLES